MTKFGERLKTLRTEENVSRKQLADALSVSLRSISYWENNQRECDFDTLLAIADYFSVSVDYLL
ncbi:MAG: helix-turn-helix domain-containing protein, partial [Clostridia bacterium]|nr:helix-turn-helix domain-containing protein [Clostridia bacterium]